MRATRLRGEGQEITCRVLAYGLDRIGTIHSIPRLILHLVDCLVPYLGIPYTSPGM